MRIAVFGLGYVGCVSAACLADAGHDVVGVDVQPEKVALIARGRPTVLEPDLADIVARSVEVGRLRATSIGAEAVSETDLSLICVGTPSAPNGSLFTGHLEQVAEEIGAALAGDDRPYTVVVRSTVFPGTCEDILLPRLEATSGRRVGSGLGLAANPEFLREGSSVRDFFDPSKIVVGALDDRSAALVESLYESIPGPRFQVPIRVAEMIKYVDNAFHAVKVTFANEIGVICKQFGLDAHEVMRVFLADTKLNVSGAYLRPGFAFGGSCLPKDLRTLVYNAGKADLRVPLLAHVLPSNEEHLRRVYELIESSGARRVGLLGLAFKAGTDDLRESPMVALAERLLGRGFDLLIHDSQVSISQLAGGNRAYVEERLPHLSKLLMQSPEEVVKRSEICVLATTEERALEAMGSADGKLIVDLVRCERFDRFEGYQGIAW